MPNTIAENLQRLIDAKSDIAAAITNKGGTVGETDGFEEFSVAIASIPSGGGGRSTIMTGSTEPTSSIGEDGDIYMQYYGAVELPAGYSGLSYIEVGSTPGPYIDTGLTSSADVSCEIQLQLTAAPTANRWFYGAFGSSKGSPILGFQNNRFEGYIVSGGVIQAYDTDVHTFVVDANGISVDGSVKQAGNWGSIATGVPLYLFARGGDVAAINNTRIFYCKQWDNGTLVRNFVPAMRESDNAIGMYDTVNDEFYANDGSGSFSGGYTNNEIINTFLKVNSAWQPLIGSDVNDVNTSGGTVATDYESLTNKPSINSVMLSGNKTYTDLGIQNCIYDPLTDELYTIVDGTRVVLASDIKAQPLIPIMTSATTPSGTIENGGYYGYGDYGNQNNWNAFDQNTATYLTYNQENVTDGWLSYEFDSGNSYYVTKIVGKFGNYQTSNSISATLYVYDDDGVEHLVGTQIIAGYSPGSASGAYKDWEFIVGQNVRKLKFVFGYKSSGTNVYTYDIQAYGYTM